MFSFSNTLQSRTLLSRGAPCLTSIALNAFLMDCRKIYVVKFWIFAQKRNGGLVPVALARGNQNSKPSRPISSRKLKQFKTKLFTIRKELLAMELKHHRPLLERLQ